MEIKKTHIILFLTVCLIQTFCTFSANIHAQADTGDYVIVFDCVPTVDHVPFSDGSIISITLVDSVATQASGSGVYYNDTTNVIRITGTMDYDISIFYYLLKFNIKNALGSCITDSVEFTVDSINSDAGMLTINSFNACSLYINYPEQLSCLDTSRILPESNIPVGSIILSQDTTGLYIDQEGGIIASRSTLGQHTIRFESQHCLSSYYAVVTIVGAQIDLEDTVSFCSGSDSLVLNINSDYYFNVPGSQEPIQSYEINTSGYYNVNVGDGACLAYDTIYIEVLESPEIELIQQRECDRVLVQALSPNTVQNTFVWSNHATSDNIEVFQDSLIWVQVTSEGGCQSVESSQIEVNRLEIESVEYTATESTCWEGGSVEISTSVVNNSIGNHRFRLLNTITNEITEGPLNILQEGIYRIQVVDNNNCIAEFDQKITVEQACLKDYPVFTPNLDGVEDSYFIPYEGTIKIYNREGILLRELATPAYWDGRNNTGDALPMGNYYMVTGEGKVVNITIIL